MKNKYKINEILAMPSKDLLDIWYSKKSKRDTLLNSFFSADTKNNVYDLIFQKVKI